jgi:hypothetical protein
MNVAVQLLAPKAQDVKTFTWDGLANRFAQRIHDTLEPKVFNAGEVSGYLLPMFFRCDKHRPPQPRRLIEEGDREVVFVGDVVKVLSIALDDGTYEAARTSATEIPQSSYYRLETTSPNRTRNSASDISP